MGLDLYRQTVEVLEAALAGSFTSSIYETAWVARLYDVDRELALPALNWLRDAQLEDGSWGALRPVYYHDRAVCTLAAILSLVQTNDPDDLERVERAIPALKYAFDHLRADGAGETVAFEMIVPVLMQEAHRLNLINLVDSMTLEGIQSTRAVKLANAPNKLISRYTSMAYSAEIAGLDGIDLLAVDELQESDGSIGCSPAATAFYYLYVKQDPKALAYLKNVARLSNGSVPHAVPTGIFECNWVLWNFALADLTTPDYQALFKPYLDYLERYWDPQKGISFGKSYSVPDGDDTSVCAFVLKKFNRRIDHEAIFSYEAENNFLTFELEANSSITTNAHFLGTLAEYDYDRNHRSVKKILNYLAEHMYEEGYWFDKWHVSPYYATAHCVWGIINYDHEMAAKALRWLMSQRLADGSWGYYGSTAEETSHCLQALMLGFINGHDISLEYLKRSADWLETHQNDPIPPLWIIKSLYYSESITKSTILSALAMYNQLAAEDQDLNLLEHKRLHG